MARRTVFSFSFMLSARMWNCMDTKVQSAKLYVSEYKRKPVNVCMACVFECLLYCMNVSVTQIGLCPFCDVMFVLGTVS